MLNALIAFSLRRRAVVLLLAAALMLWGGQAVRELPVDVFPDLNRPVVTVLTEAGGLSPEEVELLVTVPIEQTVAGVPGVERLRSQSAPGLAVVWVEFGWETDPWQARQQVTERLVHAPLPVGVRPELGPITSIMGEILLVGLWSPDGEVPGPALRTLADWTLRPRLASIPGVSQVVSIGGGVEQLQVELDPLALAAAGLGFTQARDAVAEAQGATSGGFLEHKGQEWLVRNLARTPSPEALALSPVRLPDGGVLSLGALGSVHRGVAPMRGDAGVNAKPAVVLSVRKQPQGNTLTLTEDLERALDALRPELPPGVEVGTLFRQADFIRAAIDNVEEALRDGVVLVVVVLMLFLMNTRTTAITLTAIPLSLVVTALTLRGLGLSINTMTLGGLAIAMGELVDDAIVDVENVFRRLREASTKPNFNPLRVVYEASREVRNAIVYSTALVTLVFVPLFGLSGVEGRLFAPLGVAYITSILASMAVSLTVTPALCALLLPGAAKRAQERGDGALVRWLKGADERLLRWALPRPGLVLGGAGALVVLAVGGLGTLDRSFLPPFNEGTATINVLGQPGTGLEQTRRIGQLAEGLALAVPEVRSVGRRTGRAERDEHAEGLHYTELDVDFHPEGRPRPQVLADLRARLAALPGQSVNVGQPISHRLDHMLSGVRAEIALKLYGEDLGRLRVAGEQLRAALDGVPGLVDLSLERQTLIPQIQVRVRPEAARRLGVAPGALTEALGTALAGEVVATTLEGIRPLELAVRVGPIWREDPEALAALPVALEGGGAVPLGELAEVTLATGPNEILREDGQRRLVVSANTADRALSAVVADVERVVEGLRGSLEGVTVAVGGQHAQQAEASRRVGLLALLSLLGMFAVLVGHLRSTALALQVLLNIPLALVGAVAALKLSGQPLSVATQVGFITLCGIASRNTILMIHHYVHLHQHEGLPFGAELVVRGSLDRLVPVAMTALSAGLALVPLALAGGQPGKEILTPVAQVILGGLLSSTLLDMVVTPTAFLLWGRRGLEAQSAPAEADPLHATHSP